MFINNITNTQYHVYFILFLHNRVFLCISTIPLCNVEMQS